MGDTGEVRQANELAGARTAVDGPADDAGAEFSHVARLELDELLEQLVARARDVQDTQGRLRGLLRANLEVASAVDTDAVLRHILHAARDLVNARYAALGIVRQGRLVRFLHAGIDAQAVARIGALPEGKGVLGRLVDYPRPLRLANIAENVSSVGFPEHHPPMRSFLGVPIRVGERVFGNLYLTEKLGAAEFTGDDQELVQALAAAAGVAIENATLFADAGRRQAWQSAMVAVTTELLTGDPDDALQQVIRHARTTSGSDGAAIAVPTGDPQTLRTAATEGTCAARQNDLVPLEGSAAGAALAAGHGVLISGIAINARAESTRDINPVGGTVAVPIPGERGAFGVLLVSRSAENEVFDETDLDQISVFAAQAGLALRLAQARRDSDELQMLEDRERIGEDLRDRVIQRLYALGLALQGAVPRVASEVPRATIIAGIDELDAVIREIRASVFSLNPSSSNQAAD
jgi:GAF domain-containing protein